MKLTNPLVLLVIGVGLAAAGWFATLLASRYSMATPVLPLTGLVTMGVIVVLTLILGIRVLRWRNGKKKKMLNPILAAWTLVLAQACAYTGAMLLGWHAGFSWTSCGCGTCAAGRPSPGRRSSWRRRSRHDCGGPGGGAVLPYSPEDGDAEGTPGLQGSAANRGGRRVCVPSD